ncbi:MAG: glycosyltransferase [Turicibacter sp.]|nr:glycosyltransferase [Turicibacter sp.]
MNKNDKIVSIIMPVYNGSNYLREAIDSALAQTYKNIEILVVNDGSTDNTEEIAKSYGDRIRYFKKENGGVSTALNMGIENMEGEYFSWLSHDDIYYPDRTERLINALYEDGDMKKIAWGTLDFLDENAKIHRYMITDDLAKITDSVFPIIKGWIAGCAILIHRSHFDRVGYFREDLRFVQDYEMWFRMFRNQQTVYVPHAVYVLRQHSDSTTNTGKEALRKENINFYRNIATSLSVTEITRFFGSLRKFYLFIQKCILNYGFEIDKYIKAMFRSQFTSAEWEKLHKNIKNTFVGCDVCIFCAGRYGRSLYTTLKLLNISVKYFADNDPTKHDTSIVDDINCLSFEELCKIKDEVMVIVATAAPDEIIEQLQQANFPHITTKQAIEKDLDKIMEGV